MKLNHEAINKGKEIKFLQDKMQDYKVLKFELDKMKSDYECLETKYEQSEQENIFKQHKIDKANLLLIDSE